MEVKYFRLIKTIVEEGNIVNSSEKLFLTQSALSHQLSTLEEQLGFKVFQRSRNNWKLTEEGSAFYNLSKEVLQSIDKGLNSIKRIKEDSAGQVRLGTECFSFYSRIPAFMEKMRLLYPEIDVNLVESNAKVIEKLKTHELDAALVTNRPFSNALECDELYEDEVLCIMHKEHLFSEKKYLEAKDFEKFHLIIHSFPLETVSVYEHFLKPEKVEPAKITTIPLTEVSLEMIEANMGVLCVPRWVVNRSKLSDSLIFKRLGKNGLKRKHYLVTRSQDKSKKYIRHFSNQLIEEFTSKK